MTQEQENRRSPDQPKDEHDDSPAPEQGSPQNGEEMAPGEASRKLEKGEDSDPNPLAPPVNTQAGS